MRLTDLKTYFNYLSRNKLYTFVSVFGFAVSLMFVIILSIYIKQELSVDDFQERKDRIYLMAYEDGVGFANPVADLVKEKCPEVESYCRIAVSQLVVGDKNTDRILSNIMFADSTFFKMFSFKLIVGDASHALEAHNSAVISESFSKKIFGDKNPVGSEYVIHNKVFTISGIIDDFPRNTAFTAPDIILNYNSVPIRWGAQSLTGWNIWNFSIFFLTKDGTDIKPQIPVLLDYFKKNFWLYKEGFAHELRFIPLKEVYFMSNAPLCIQSNDRILVVVYLIITILILTIAIFNYINLTVAQVGFRGKEAAMKRLLGCSRNGLIKQFLTESLLLTGFTFIVGLFLAFLFEPFFNRILNTNLNIGGEINLHFILSASLFILCMSIIAGVIPTIIISSSNPIEIVKGAFTRNFKTRYSRVLIVFQYSIAIVLLICSIFIKKQTDFMIGKDVGFNRDRILVMNNVLDTTRVQGLKSILSAIAGVEAVSYSCGTPIDGGNNNTFDIDNEQFSFQIFVVDSAFFSIYGITNHPFRSSLSENTYWLNKRGCKALHISDNRTQTEFGNEGRVQISGIVSDFNIKSLHYSSDLIGIHILEENTEPWSISVKIANNVDLLSTTAQVKKAYSEYNGGIPFDSRYVDVTIQKWYDKEEKISSIMSAFTILTIIIMIMGVFAMSLYMVKQKEKEIGIRKINGATEKEILFMLNNDSLVMILIAFVIACPVSYYAMTRWLEGFAYKIELSWWVFSGAGIIVLLLSLLSVSYQAWKAARVNPIDSIKKN